jgi:hypothetical protein
LLKLSSTCGRKSSTTLGYLAIGNIFIDQELCCEQKLKFAKVQLTVEKKSLFE